MAGELIIATACVGLTVGASECYSRFMASSGLAAARPRIIAVFETTPRSGFPAALLKQLRAAADVQVLIAGREGVAFGLAATNAARAGGYCALVVCDGPAARRALPGLSAAGLPSVLAIDGDAAPSSSALTRPRRPGPGIHGTPHPAQIWQFGRAGLDSVASEFLPGAFHHAPKPLSAWLAKRIEELRLRAPAPGKHALATIVVPCWNQLHMTRECLRRIQEWTAGPFEALIVDNGSTDGTAAYVESLCDKRFRVIRNDVNLGFARAINQGIGAARGEYIVWLNNDCFVTPRWLDHMIAAVERAPWIGMVGPFTNETSGMQKLTHKYDLAQLPYFAEAFSLSRAGRLSWVHRLTGFCLLQRAELARRIGGLDERFGFGCYEDLDYCLRARQAGYELFIAEDVFVHHHGHATFDGSKVPFNSQVQVNREIFIDKWCRKSLSFLDEIDAPLAAGA